jgi:hypothetical protein
MLVPKDSMEFTKWAKRQDVVLWTHVPPKAQIEWVKREKVRTIGMTFWHELLPGHKEIYKSFDTVVSPSYSCGELVKRAWMLMQTRSVPWDSGLPITLKDDTRELATPKILFPLLDRTPDYVSSTALLMVERVLEHTEAPVTVAFMPSHLWPAKIKYLNEMQRRYPEQLTLIRSPSIANRPFIYAHHDLTVWPVRAADIGIIALESITMGTPVLAFEIQPLLEILNRHNSLTITCTTTQSAAGAPIADEAYTQLEEYLFAHIYEPTLLRHLELTTTEGLSDRRNTFSDCWKRIVGNGRA